MTLEDELVDACEPLVDACMDGNLDEVQELVKQGADINVDNNGPLRWAARDGHLEMVKYLVDRGSDIRTIGDAPLRLAVKYDHLEIVIYLRNIAGPEWKCHDCLLRTTCMELCNDFRK